MNRFDVDTAKQSISLEEAAQRCGVVLDAKQSGGNARIDCPFGCQGDHAGKREVSISTQGDKLFCCHSYQCGFRGNILMLMHGWLTGSRPASGRLQGADFKRVREVLLRESTTADKPPPAAAVSQSSEPAFDHSATATDEGHSKNVPLSESENEKARELVGLESLFITDPAAMSPAASAYWRRRRDFLRPESCAAWGVGVRPTKNSDDKRGWSLRGQVCYRFLSEDNQVLCYVGRDPEYEEKLRTFDSLSEEQRLAQKMKAPIKHRFPSGFHRGLELYGQQSDRLEQHPEYRDMIADYGVIVVEGFNDVLALDHLRVPAVGICSNRITLLQVAKVARWARHFGGSQVTLMLDCEDTGDEGAKEALWLFAQHAPDLRVRLAWSQAMHGGQFRGRQPESLTSEEVHNVLLQASRL